MKKLISLMLLCALLFFLPACSKNQDSTAEKVNSVRNDLTLYSRMEPKTLDQHESMEISTALLIRNLYANLYRINSDGQIVPELAENYKVNKDYTEYTFKLKKDIFFSDGTPITAGDAAFTYQRAMDSHIDYYKVLKNVQVLDDRTFVITLHKPNNSFLHDMTVEYMCVMSKAAIEGGMDVANKPTVTSGAYFVEKWDKGNHCISLKANPHFLNGEAQIKNVIICYKLDKESYKALLDGTVDYLANVTVNEVPYLRAADEVDLIGFDNYSWNLLTLNQNKPYYADDKVRQAICCALDLNYIIDTALDGLGTPAPIMVNSSIHGYIRGFDTQIYDLKKAKECMKASAYPNGFTMMLEVADEEWYRVGKAIQTQLKEIGIDVVIVRGDLKTLLAHLFAYDYDAIVTSYSMSSGDVSHAIPLFSKGGLHFSQGDDYEIGEILQRSLAVEEKEKNELLSKAYTLMRQKNSYIGLYWPTVFDAKAANLKLKSPVTSEKYILANMFWN